MTSIFSFPFEQIGSILRTLSLSGDVQNLFAIVLYILFCSSPILYLIYRRSKKRHASEDYILIFISFCLFCSIYLCINPGYISEVTGLSFLTEQQLYTALGSTLWSVIICYILFRTLKGIERKEAPDLLIIIRYIVTAITILTVLDIFGNDVFSLIADIQKTAAGNTMDSFLTDIYSDDVLSGYSLNATYAWLVIKYVLDCIPSLLLLRILFFSQKTIRMLQADSFSETAISELHKLGIRCRNVVIAIGLLTVAENVIQLLFSQYLLTAHYQVTIPVYTLLFVFIILLLSKKFSESREYKLDNDSFI